MKRLMMILMFTAFILQSCAVRVAERNKTEIVVVKKAPRNHSVVVVKNKRYYTWGGRYYKKTPRGFVLIRV